MKSLRLITCLLLAVVASHAVAAQLNVFAAASLSDAFAELAPKFQAATGDTLRCNFGASGTLALQIREGAPADVIFSADELRMDQLEKAGLLMPGTRRTLLANQLVLVVASDRGAPVTVPADLTKAAVRHLAIGEPATVPAGTYAREYLRKLGLWKALHDKRVPLDNVRAVLAAVGTGNADAGFVYRTDAMISTRVRIAFAVPLAAGPRIRYPAAVVQGTKSPAAARALMAFLAGPEAQKVFAKYGFLSAN